MHKNNGRKISKQRNKTTFNDAIINNRADTVAEMIKYKAVSVNTIETNGVTSLMIACDKDQPNMDIIRSLVENGANVNFRNSKRESALYIACKHYNLVLIKYLITNGAKVYNMRPDIIEDEQRNIVNNIVEFLLSQPNSDPQFLNYQEICMMLLCQVYICDSRKLELFEEVIKRDDSILFSTYATGSTPLNLVCKYNNLAFAKLLLEYGASSMPEQYQDGHLPLHIAIKNDNAELVELLLRFSVSANDIDSYGNNALMLALKYGTKLGSLFLPLVHNINQKNIDGWSALTFAVDKRDMELIQQLINCYADIDIYTLKRAVSVCNWDIFELIWRHVDASVPSENLNFSYAVLDNWSFYTYNERLFRTLLEREDVQFGFHAHIKKLIQFVTMNSPAIEFPDQVPPFLELIKDILLRDDKIQISPDALNFLLLCGRNTEYFEHILDIFFQNSQVLINNEVIMRSLNEKLPSLPVVIRYYLNFNPLNVYWTLARNRRLISKYLEFCLRFFTIPQKLTKQIIHALTVNTYRPCLDYLQLLNNHPTVPSLTELSRNVIRKCLQKTCRDTKSYFAALKVLPLPLPIRDIVHFKTAVNVLHPTKI